MSALKDFFYSEKGVWAYLVPMLGATAMLVQGSIGADQWLDFAKVMAGIYVSGKTIQGGAKAFADARQVATGSRAELDALKEKLATNDKTIDELIDGLAEAKKRTATPEE